MVEAARMAQNRRELTDRSIMSSARRVFRPTIAGIATPDSPIAFSPPRLSALVIALQILCYYC